MTYTARQAATAAGVATSTITKAIKTGKISAQRDESGAWSIDPSELHRVYPPNAEKPFSKASIEQDATPRNTPENRGLERLVETLQEQIRDLREDRDGWRQQAERLVLRPPAPVPDAPASGQGRPVGGLWSWLRGKTPSNN